VYLFKVKEKEKKEERKESKWGRKKKGVGEKKGGWSKSGVCGEERTSKS
jgi:hypothetical protein